MRGRAAPPKPNISERPAEWGAWEWRNHIVDPRAVARLRGVQSDYPTRMQLKRACLNLVYSVQFFERTSSWGQIDHLIIRRHDGAAEPFPWAELQRIKDELLGSERVAVEVFPAQSQLVDDAHCRHLWVLPDAFALPFGLHLEGWKHDS